MEVQETLTEPSWAVYFNTKVTEWWATIKRERLPMFVSYEIVFCVQRSCQKCISLLLIRFVVSSISLRECPNYCLFQSVDHICLSVSVLFVRQQALVCLFHEYPYGPLFSWPPWSCARAWGPIHCRAQWLAAVYISGKALYIALLSGTD